MCTPKAGNHGEKGAVGRTVVDIITLSFVSVSSISPARGELHEGKRFVSSCLLVCLCTYNSAWYMVGAQ